LNYVEFLLETATDKSVYQQITGWSAAEQGFDSRQISLTALGILNLLINHNFLSVHGLFVHILDFICVISSYYSVN
jgi:hypothetical protein